MPLTSSQFTQLIASTDRKIQRSDITFLQQSQTYPLVADVLKRPSGNANWTGTAYEKKYQLTQSPGPRGVDFFEGDKPRMGPPGVTARIPLAKYSDENVTYDIRAFPLNVGAERFYNMRQNDEDTRMAGIVEFFESEILAAPANENDEKHLWGLLGVAALSQTSGGVFVAQEEPAINGVYVKYGDNVVRSTCYTLDRLLYERWRTAVATRPSSLFDVADAQRIDKMLDLVNFEPMPMMSGTGEPNDGFVILMGTVDRNKYKHILRDRGEISERDLYANGDLEVGGGRIRKCVKLDADARRLIIGLNLRQWEVPKVAGFWFRRMEPESMSAYVKYVPMAINGQMICRNPRNGIWLIHGSF